MAGSKASRTSLGPHYTTTGQAGHAAGARQEALAFGLTWYWTISRGQEVWGNSKMPLSIHLESCAQRPFDMRLHEQNIEHHRHRNARISYTCFQGYKC